MKAITFLGATEAHETAYIMPDGREHAAPYFGVALARCFPYSDMPYSNMTVFVTERARAMHWETFQGLAEDYVDKLEAITIPDGADDNELWSLFQSVVDAVDEREEVIFDITHGFRSVTFLSLLAVAYLRQVKQIDLRAILYGNFEARDRSAEPQRTPVIDLSDFVSLFDWMTAADRFVRFGDATDLAERLRAAKPNQSRQPDSLPDVITADMLRRAEAGPNQSQQANRLARVANSLEKVSKALRLIRPNEAMDASATLDRQLSDPVVTHSIESNARPFVLLADSIKKEYTRLALSSSHQREQPVSALRYERDMINWLLEHNQFAQAMAIAREWIPSWVMFHMKMYDFTDRNQRHRAAEILSGSVVCTIDQIEEARNIYEQLRKVRNDLLHAGKSGDALGGEEMEEKVRKVCHRLSEFELPG